MLTKREKTELKDEIAIGLFYIKRLNKRIKETQEKIKEIEDAIDTVSDFSVSSYNLLVEKWEHLKISESYDVVVRKNLLMEVNELIWTLNFLEKKSKTK